MNQAGVRRRLWSIILAGGDGERLKPTVEQWLGRHLPKQYCAFVGRRSMLEHTLDRADRLSLPEHKVTVISSAHREDAWPQLRHRDGKVIEQPANRGTAVGVFAGLTEVRARDPHAVVVIYPSDHFVHPEERFVEVVERAVEAAIELEDRLVLLGVTPQKPEAEYGWIQPGRDFLWLGNHRVRAVQWFLEKPGSFEASCAFKAGGLWNTLVLVARVEALWAVGWRCLPLIMPLLEEFSGKIGTAEEEASLESIYRAMPGSNFSSDVLQQASDQLAVIELSGVMWSDWGNRERIVDTLRQIGKPLAFPMDQKSSRASVAR